MPGTPLRCGRFAYNWKLASLVHTATRSARVSAVCLDLIVTHQELSARDAMHPMRFINPEITSPDRITFLSRTIFQPSLPSVSLRRSTSSPRFLEISEESEHMFLF
jgi:hypothetical protein